MQDEANLPLVPDDDPVVDRLLGSTGRFSPKQGFEDRVIHRVRVPLPHWLRSLRDRAVGLTSGVSGWTILATFSLATAAAWTTAVAVGARFWGEISGVASGVLSEALGLAREVFNEGIAPGWELTKAEVSAWLASLGLNPTMVVVGYGIVILVCAVALKFLTAEPARRRGTIHATH
jgi:hypothetical protein